MGRKMFRTLIKAEHKFGDNQYVRGRVSGMMNVICNGAEKHGFANARTEAGRILTTECTKRQYKKFMKVVEEHYPDLCVFDYK